VHALLDLQRPEIVVAGAVTVEIPFYPQRDFGDRIMLRFYRVDDALPQVSRYYYLARPDDLPFGRTLEVQVAPLWALKDGHYDVSYVIVDRADNMSTSTATPVNVVNAPAGPAVGSAQTSLFGTYRGNAGSGSSESLIDSWVVALDYDLPLDTSGILLRSLDGLGGYSTNGAKLGLYRQGSGQPFVTLACQGGNWRIEPKQVSPVHLRRGDVVLLKLENAQPQQVYLALTM
jgi:hypothetical protein